jgi:hypothetical protein
MNKICALQLPIYMAIGALIRPHMLTGLLRPENSGGIRFSLSGILKSMGSLTK